MVKKDRPVNLDLTQFHFPVMAIVSITHRITGVLIFLMLPFMLYALSCSLRSAYSFETLRDFCNYGVVRFLIWLALTAIAFHVVAGVRHLIMDLGYGESVAAGQRSAKLVFIITAALFVLLGVWLWA